MVERLVRNEKAAGSIPAGSTRKGVVMHGSSYGQMGRVVGKYLQHEGVLSVLDIGSKDVNGTYRPLFAGAGWKYVGADIERGKNVDVVIDDGYEWKMIGDGQFDVVISGQALEHMERPWLAAKAMYRVCKAGGVCVAIAPAVWDYHQNPKDCWRIYPDGMRAIMVAEAGFVELECSMVRCENELMYNATDTVFVGRK